MNIYVTIILLALSASQTTQNVKVPTVALYPWSFAENEKGTNPTAISTAEDVLRKLFEKRASFEIVSEARSIAAWKDLGFPEVPYTVEELGQLPNLEDPKKLLTFGEKLGVDYVCTGTLGWTIRSVWVGLGPKTKASANINMLIIDVKKKEVALEQRDFKSDSTKVEKWYETAGALLVSWGITIFSGGPKTPHMQNAAVKGLGAATDPFFVNLPKRIDNR